MPSFPTSVRTAGFILLALLAYFVIRGVMREPVETSQTETSLAETEADEVLPEVITSSVTLAPHQVIASLKGSTEPDREVTIRSGTMGTVTNANVREGQLVGRGTVVCGLDVESRAARIAEAEAAVASARLDYDGASQLEEKGWTTSNRAAATKAALDGAEAALAASKIELEKTRIKAPFRGIFETRMAERGDFLSVGAPCGRIVDLDPIIVAVDATENQMGAIDPSQAVDVELSTGETAIGTVRYVASTASTQTRTFRVEVEIPNPENEISAGLTATVRLGLGEVPAMLMTPANLVLHDDGRVGVRYVDDADVVQFTEVSIVDDAPGGVWVTGIPENVNLLAAGQDFLKEGVKVSTRMGEGL
ncbi:MAG: efflux RND transporter periplasmic adaptor subunit [Henriciella sp.]